MVGERRWGLKAALPLVAVMVAVGGWQGYKGVLKVLGEAHAQAQIDGRFFPSPPAEFHCRGNRNGFGLAFDPSSGCARSAVCPRLLPRLARARGTLLVRLR